MGMKRALMSGNSPSQYRSILIHWLARCWMKDFSSLMGTLFSDSHATTHAWQPVHRSMSTTMDHFRAVGRSLSDCRCVAMGPFSFTGPRWSLVPYERRVT